MDVDTQRAAWWGEHQQLVAELDGRAPHRWSRPFVAVGVLLAVLLVGTTTWGTVRGDAVRSWDRDLGLLPSVLLGAAIALMLVVAVVHARGGSVEAPRRPGRGLHWDHRRRMARLVATADLCDPHQVRGAAALARRLEAEDTQLLLFAALLLLMLSQLVGADSLSTLLLGVLGVVLSGGGLVALAVQDTRARTFLRRTAPWRPPVG